MHPDGSRMARRRWSGSCHEPFSVACTHAYQQTARAGSAAGGGDGRREVAGRSAASRRYSLSALNATALVLEKPRRLVPRELPLPEITDDDALLRVDACGLCGTDHEEYTGHLAGPGPFVPGHETIGTVERIGRDAARRWGVGEGDRVAVEVFLSCRECDECRAGSYQRCAKHGLRDMYGYVSVDNPPGLWGGYATHQYLAPDSIVHRVPDSLDPVLATLFNPLGAGVRWAATVPGTKEGDVVAIL